jgi:A/G-specific adenine glycosylase
VKRVLARFFGVEGWPGRREVEQRLWSLAEGLLPKRGIASYTQGLMDLGATVCVTRNPACTRCPVNRDCEARRTGRVHEIPAPRPRKTLPVKRTTWLVLLRAGEVLLEKRPSRGIWGGLWAFPERQRSALEDQCRTLGCDVRGTSRLQALEHGFTHFRLMIRPVLCEVTPSNCARADAGTIWLSLGEARQAAVPAPVRRLIERLDL